MKTTKFNQKVFLGKVDGEKIYLSAPSWDCGWYWGFGYLGNNNCHYHVDGLMRDCNLFDGLKKHFDKGSFIIKESDIWIFAELMKTFYTLKETAELLGRGGSHYTTNPIAYIIKNTDEVKRINEIVLPALFDAIFDVLERNKDNNSIFNKIVSLYLDGDTQKVVDYMNKKGIKTDDIKNINGLTSSDYNTIHTYFWREYHKNKKQSK